jgi:hypothetical protein
MLATSGEVPILLPGDASVLLLTQLARWGHGRESCGAAAANAGACKPSATHGAWAVLPARDAL